MNRFIESIVNTEQLLHMALHVANTIPDDQDPIRSTADRVIIGYIIGNFEKNGIESWTEEDILKEYSTLFCDFLLTNMVEDGILEADLDDKGEFLYKLSPSGKSIAEKLK